MIVMDNKNLINGSSALAPKQKPQTRNLEEELKRQKKERIARQRAQAQIRLKKQAKVIKGIGISFLVGVLLIGRYAAVYNMQKDIVKVKSQIHNLNMENEDLVSQLLKSNSIQQIEETAKTKLHMITPDKKNIIHLETTKDYFAKNTEDNKKNKQEDFIAKLRNILF
ncbi:hypothetical protein [Clostridium swellfunianum]|uniref:hypothetical protein n=1 Tax=Clostridium swellfunianum TaxID=1367462 RepID=UPI00202F169E|nr:hypothetical protein [Clostridium swellfunianum]